eukprot:3884256-Pyramimonas_sp.AAC.1
MCNRSISGSLIYDNSKFLSGTARRVAASFCALLEWMGTGDPGIGALLEGPTFWKGSLVVTCRAP